MLHGIFFSFSAPPRSSFRQCVNGRLLFCHYRMSSGYRFSFTLKSIHPTRSTPFERWTLGSGKSSQTFNCAKRSWLSKTNTEQTAQNWEYVVLALGSCLWKPFTSRRRRRRRSRSGNLMINATTSWTSGLSMWSLGFGKVQFPSLEGDSS